MSGIRDTAYPQMKSAPSARELADVYTPNFVELVRLVGLVQFLTGMWLMYLTYAMTVDLALGIKAWV
jgi:hypothetical protein